jgi:RimJ/RimL family protein N-acetyltransferase
MQSMCANHAYNRIFSQATLDDNVMDTMDEIGAISDKALQLIPPTLVGKTVELHPLQQGHAAGLLEAAADGRLWDLKVTVVPAPDTIDQYIRTALDGRQAGTVMPFVIVRRDTGRLVGSTRFWKVDHANKKLEIGHTWLSSSVQRSGINTEAKFLLLSQAFDAMKFVRVQFTTDELNEKSRAAILRIGAKQEGIVRNERIMPDGRKRNSVRFSIIDSEWPEVKAMLQEKMGF